MREELVQRFMKSSGSKAGGRDVARTTVRLGDAQSEVESEMVVLVVEDEADNAVDEVVAV